MDSSTRWETEAMRASAAQRTNPPRPSSKRSTGTASAHPPIADDKMWVTLKEAEAATSIPSNTIRKWVRKGTVDSYLESDGQLALRMVDLDSVLDRAETLGRTIEEQEVPTETPSDGPPVPLSRGTGESASQGDQGSVSDRRGTEEERSDDSGGSKAPPAPEGTMLVPIDAWNKMLNQLGNLHEAGQQLAEARERAAKAETETVFLRERLAEMREKTTDHRPQTTDPEPAPVESEEREPATVVPPSSRPPFKGDGRADASQGDNDQERSDGGGEAQAEAVTDVETTTYWRYLTLGWRDRKRRSRR